MPAFPNRSVCALALLSIALVACNLANVPDSLRSPTPTEDLSPADPPTATIEAPTAAPTDAVVILESLRVPGVSAVDNALVYDQATRATLGRRDMFFWPDGNIGFYAIENGYRFFAANSVLSARTTGSLEDPAAAVEDNRQRIGGASSEFAHLSGGPIYRDPATGMLIMFYHAERHLDGVGRLFHAALGLAVSFDDGKNFKDLGIILETNAPPDISAPCCADMAGAPFAIKDGTFYLYFRDRNNVPGGLQVVHLALATAPVAEVVAAAGVGRTSEWRKYDGGAGTPGLRGSSLPLESGNPRTSWFSVTYNSTLDQFLMVIARHGFISDPSQLYLITSEDGIHWSPRVLLDECECELTYPSIIGVEGDPYSTGKTFYIYHVRTPPDEEFRWHQTPLYRMTVTLSGEMERLPSAWEFETEWDRPIRSR